MSQPSFRDIYVSHFDYVWASLRRLGVRTEDAQDVAQKVFVATHLKLPEFERRSTIRTWLFRVCLHAASQYRRSAPIRREVATSPAEMDDLWDRQESIDEAGHEHSEAQERVAVAEALLNKLPEPQRLVFVLFELEEMSGAQIAKLLGISLGTVRSRLRLARERFSRGAKRLSIRKEAAKTRSL